MTALLANRGRRRRRRNPPILATLKQGAIDACVGAGAQLATALIAPKLPNFIDAPASGGAGTVGPRVNEALVAAALGVLGAQVFGPGIARAMVQGALQGPIINFARPQLQKMGLLPAVATAPALPRASATVAGPMFSAYTGAPRLMSGTLAGDPDDDGAGYYR